MDMLKDSCKKSLVVFAIPIILSLLTQQLYNLCDTLIVGRLLGADMLSAVGNAGTIINLTTCFRFWCNRKTFCYQYKS